MPGPRPATSFRRGFAPTTPGLDALMDGHLHFVATVDLREMHANVIARRGGYVLADEVRADRKLAMAAGANADDRGKGEIAVALDDLVRDPRDGAADVVRTEQRSHLALLSGLAGPVLKGDRAPTSIGIPYARGCA